jgi:hypothetical protein
MQLTDPLHAVDVGALAPRISLIVPSPLLTLSLVHMTYFLSFLLLLAPLALSQNVSYLSSLPLFSLFPPSNSHTSCLHYTSHLACPASLATSC